jgi:hypothetical protein
VPPAIDPAGIHRVALLASPANASARLADTPTARLRPRRDATPEQLKRLGTALEEWTRREQGNGVLYSIDPKRLASLLSGEPPDPLGVQVMEHNKGVSWEKIRQDLGPLASDRSVRFTVKDEPHCTRDKVIESLRQAIPDELVEDVVIDGVSWTE